MKVTIAIQMDPFPLQVQNHVARVLEVAALRIQQEPHKYLIPNEIATSIPFADPDTAVTIETSLHPMEEEP